MSMTAEQRIVKVMERNRLVEAQLISLQEERDEARRAIDINLGEAAQRRLEEDEKAAREKKDPLYFKEYEGDHFSIFQNRDLLNTCVRDIALFLKEGGP